MKKEHSVDHLMELLTALGRRNSLRDPMASLVDAEFTAPQLHAVMWLGVDGELPMGELARRVGATEKTITGIVDRLEREGYVKRVRNEEDRRVVRVALTKKGQAASQVVKGQARENTQKFLSLLDDRDLSDLFRILEHLVQRLDAFAAAAEQGDHKHGEHK